MKGRDQVDVERFAGLLLKEDLRQALNRDVAPHPAFSNAGILAVDAMQRAMREEHGPAARFA